MTVSELIQLSVGDRVVVSNTIPLLEAYIEQIQLNTGLVQVSILCYPSQHYFQWFSYLQLERKSHVSN